MARLLPMAALVLLLTSIACGGGSGGGGDDGPTPTLVEVTFPTGRCLAAGPTLTVRGFSPDPSRVTHVAVDGVPATSTDGFATWVAVVPLDPGENTVRVNVTDDLAVDHPAQIELRVRNVGFYPIETRDVAYDAANEWIYALDAKRGSVFRVNPATGYRDLVSGPEVGSGVAMDDPEGLAVDPAGGRAWIADGSSGLRTIIEIDLASGDRTVCSSNSVGTGLSLSDPVGIVYDESTDRILIVDRGVSREAIVEIDPATGNRTPVSSAARGGGPLWSSPVDLALNPAGLVVYVLDEHDDAVYHVFRGNGDRSILSDAGRGTGESIVSGTGIAYGTTFSGLFVLSQVGTGPGVLSVNTASGDRAVVTSEVLGSGPALNRTGGIVYADVVAGPVVADLSHRLITVDPTTALRTLTYDDRIGSGPPVSETVSGPWSVAALPSGTHALISTLDGGVPKLVSIDLPTADRTLIPGSGVEPEGLWNLTLYAGASRVAATYNDEIYTIELATSAWSVLTDGSTGPGPTFSYAADMAYDATGDRLYFVDPNNDLLARIDPATGLRESVSDATAGSGPLWPTPDAVVVDPANDRAFVADGGIPHAVYVASLGTGTRSVLADNVTGTGGLLTAAAGLALDLANNRLLLISDGHPTWVTTIQSIDVTTGDHDQKTEFFQAWGPWPDGVMDSAHQPELNRLFLADRVLQAVILIDVPPGGGPLGDRVIVAN